MRLTRAGLAFTAWGENIGAGLIDPQTLYDAWLDSPAHRNQLLGNFRYAGIGGGASSTGVPYWTLVVAN